MRFPLDLSIFDKYILSEGPIDCGDYQITIDNVSTPDSATFCVQATLRKPRPPLDGSMPKLEISFAQHEAGHKHQEPHIQVYIYRPCAGDQAHIGTYYLTLEVNTFEEAENIVRGYLCIARDMLGRIAKDLPSRVFNLGLIEEDNLDQHIRLLQEKIHKIDAIRLKPSSQKTLRLPGHSAIKVDAEGYATLTRQQFRQLFDQSDEKTLMLPLLDLVK